MPAENNFMGSCAEGFVVVMFVALGAAGRLVETQRVIPS
jgi:hypothetical protein